MHDVVMYGDQVAGESARLKAELESLLKNFDKQTYDLAEILHKVKSKGYFAPFSTMKEYTDSLGLKDSKARYLPKMVEVYEVVGIPREKYEPLGISVNRAITSLDPNSVYKNPLTGNETPMSEFIVGFVDKLSEGEITPASVMENVRTLKGLVGDNDISWLNIPFTRAVLEKVIRPALEKIKAAIGSVRKDEEGFSQDASDAAAFEVMAVEILNDPKFGVEVYEPARELGHCGEVTGMCEGKCEGKCLEIYRDNHDSEVLIDE